MENPKQKWGTRILGNLFIYIYIEPFEHILKDLKSDH